MTRLHRARLLAILAWLVALVALVGENAARKIGATQHADEIYWTGQAYYLDLLLRGEIRHPDWQLMPARENPPVAKYLIGLALRAGGRRIETPERLGLFLLEFRSIPGAWGYDPSSVAKRREVVDRVSPETLRARTWPDFQPVPRGDLAAGRVLMAAFALIVALGLANLGRLCGWPVGGMIAALAFAAHPIAVELYTRIGNDLIALGFSVWSVNLLVALVRRDWESDHHPRRDALLYGLGLGLLVALALGSKMNAALVVMLIMAVGLAFLVVRIARRRWRPLAPMTALIISGVVGTVVFIAANPTLYPDLLRGLRNLNDENHQSFKIMAAFIGTALHGPGERLRAIGILLFGRAELLWPALAAVAWRTVDALRARSAGALVVSAWWWITLVTLTAWLPFGWDRYVLPLLPPTVLILASFLVDLVGGIGRLARRPPCWALGF